MNDPEIHKSFEDEFAAYTCGKYCVGLASGLDALWITLILEGSE